MDEHAVALTKTQQITVAVLSAIVGLTRFVSMAKGPWDWDEVLFCLSLTEFDVGAHRPHPPGFPLHVVLGRLAKLVTQSDFSALQAVNLLAGFAVFPVVFWLAWTLRYRFEGSLWVATVVAFLPNVWFYGGTAFSDVPAMVFFLAAAAAYLSAEASAPRYALASFLAGLAVLYRPQGALILALPWALASWRLVRAKRWRVVAGGVLLTIVVVAIGYGGAVAATGYDRYTNALRHHARYVRSTDAIGSPGRPPVLEALRMLLDPYEAGKVSLLINALACVGILFGRRKVVAQILLMFVPVFFFTLVASHPLGASRISLGYITGVILLAAEGAFVPGRFAEKVRVPVAALLLVAIVGRLVFWELPAFETPRRTDPPQVQAVLWARRHVSRQAAIVYQKGIDPWVRYYLADRTTVPYHDAMARPGSYPLKNAWLLNVGTPGNSGALMFLRPRNRTWNVAIHRGFEAYAQPFSSAAEFGDGWYDDEFDGFRHWRWASRRCFVILPGVGGRRLVTLALDVPVDIVGPAELRFSLDGRPLRVLRATTSDQRVRLVIDTVAGRSNLLRIDSDRGFVPAEKGNSDDRRELAWMLQSWRIDPVAEAPVLRRAG